MKVELNMIRWALFLPFVLAVGLSSISRADDTKKPPPPVAPIERQPARIKLPSVLSDHARDLLRPRMRWHAAELNDLVHSVVTLDYESAGTLARAIVSEESLARPFLAKDAALLNAQLPEQFFAFQERLKKACAQVAAASARRDSQAAAEALGQVTSTCVRCHAVFFKPAAR
jgi:hypothetical protein